MPQIVPMLNPIASQRLNEAVDAMNRNDYSSALSISSQLRMTTPSPQALYIELLAMAGLGMIKQTERLLRKNQQFLEQWPDGLGMSMHVQGRLAMRQNKPEVAVPLFRAAFERLSKNQACLLDYAEALFHTTQFAQAHDLYVQALTLGPPSPSIYTNLAACCMRMQQFDQAFAYNYVGWTNQPDGVMAQKIGHAFILSGNPREAAKHFHQAMKLGNHVVEAYHGMAEAYRRLNMPKRAVRYLRMALGAPNLPRHQELGLLQTLGNCYEKMGEVEAWIPYSQRLLDLDPKNISFLLNMGNAMQMLGRYQEALIWADKAEEAAPGHPDITYFRGFIHLLQGRWDIGWAGYEWRWRALPFQEKYGAVLRPLQSPMWNGVADLKGKVVMALCEQGAGDLMQFGLYCKSLIERGAIVDLLAPPSMTELMMSMPWIREVHDNYFRVPPHDYHVSLMTMPLYDKTLVETIPTAPIPYLKAPRKRERFSEKFTVALSWYGDPKHSYDAWRSMPTHYLYDLIKAFPDVQFVSMQMAPHQRTLQKYFKAGLLIDGMEGATTFTDTAALIDACDLVISVDTSTAHLAACMNKPVWTLISHYADWRWLGAESTTRWYKNMRLFRQSKVHDWRELLQRVAVELRVASKIKPVLEPDAIEPATPEPVKPKAASASAETAAKKTKRGTKLTLGGLSKRATNSKTAK